MSDNFTDDDVMEIAQAIGTGLAFSKDMLILSGGDKEIVKDMSKQSYGAENFKARVIDARITKLEKARVDDKIQALKDLEEESKLKTMLKSITPGFNL